MGLERERRGEQWPSTLNRCFVGLVFIFPFTVDGKYVFFRLCFIFILFYHFYWKWGPKSMGTIVRKQCVCVCAERECD